MSSLWVSLSYLCEYLQLKLNKVIDHIIMLVIYLLGH